MKNQIVLIHGGDTFRSYESYFAFLKNFQIDFDHFKKSGWKKKLEERLGSAYEIITLEMPNKMNAKYAEWNIWFDKFVPFFESQIVLVGHSLGGIFLAKYLAENDFSKKILAVFLIAAPYDENGPDDSLADFLLPNSLGKFEAQGGEIFLCHSKDDPVVPFDDLEKYARALPNAHQMIFEDRKHFNQEEFPELTRAIIGVFDQNK